ncbi:tRNA (adenosine(37)-N6)-threonylcarbamoyltransferase complex dimerization subunit type 1 TsaB [Halomonas sp. GD1P12]|uniref:tRNA (adenosine(37)-N6)-threonylcarbamoyltransferase complex dimerization subunit type 1 TsaB n=1 Tax=Halomonas sp. GD1P12 TaxID=2982691 RepID=UPI0021E440DF|nr:tRNA (adenosine(37)-N6)-threonylcarbamoyltransferase complex dimerization subunit type 1 TsaB [Halomonas sp. GD1P12]UYG00544.1 tRNA (adenosine(37)-N6)-threonylcarbamoyltransferase complex dimerization subunit type 1 TsaB [Halomonas sp. GD1P12]
MSSYLLALDASSSACSAALIRAEGEHRECLSRFEHTPRAHTKRLLPMIDEVLGEAGITPKELDGVAYGHGPGSFTGLRIAAGTAQGLAFGLDCPLVGVSTLEALALQAHRRYHFRHIVTALDARMGEVYTAAWRCGEDLASLCDDEVVIDPARVILPDQQTDWVGVGSGFALWDQFDDLLKASMTQHLTDLEPRAEEMAWIGLRGLNAGAGRAPIEVQPVYLRNDVAWKKPA